MAGQFISYSRQQKAVEELSELDSVVEEKKKELKKQKELDHFKERVKGIGTTKEESQKEIDLWLGLFVPPNNKANVFIVLAILMSVALFSFAEYEDEKELQKNRYDKLREKTLSTDYTLNDGVIDCPIEVKKELLDRLDKGFVYLSVGFGNHHLYYYSETGYMEKGHSEKGYFGYLPNAFDNEYDYFKDQLTAYKLYKISDIVMDNALRNTDSVQE